MQSREVFSSIDVQRRNVDGSAERNVLDLERVALQAPDESGADTSRAEPVRTEIDQMLDNGGTDVAAPDAGSPPPPSMSAAEFRHRNPSHVATPFGEHMRTHPVLRRCTTMTFSSSAICTAEASYSME